MDRRHGGGCIKPGAAKRIASASLEKVSEERCWPEEGRCKGWRIMVFTYLS